MKLSSDEVERVIAGIRAGMEVIVGGSRCHSTYRVNAAGALVVEDFDEGMTDERPFSEEGLRMIIAGSPESFLDVLRRPLRAALSEALLGIRENPRACLADLLVYGESVHHKDLLEAVLGWPDAAPAPELRARLATTDGLDVYHAIMSALGYGTKSIAAGQFGVRFYAALEEMSEACERRNWRRYRAEFREMAGDSAGALQDLRWELARSANEDDAASLRRQIAAISDR